MQTAAKSDLVSVGDYLAAEEISQIKHEYLGGVVYAMSGVTKAHNEITGNLFTTLRSHLKGGPCKIYFTDVRLHFEIPGDEYFYYPDIVVTCDKRGTHARFVQYPKLVIEVLSESAERSDRHEKFSGYTRIPSLDEYVLVGQDSREVTVFRRQNRWKPEKLSGTKAKLILQSLKLSLPLSAIYGGI